MWEINLKYQLFVGENEGGRYYASSNNCKICNNIIQEVKIGKFLCIGAYVEENTTNNEGKQKAFQQIVKICSKVYYINPDIWNSYEENIYIWDKNSIIRILSRPKVNIISNHSYVSLYQCISNNCKICHYTIQEVKIGKFLYIGAYVEEKILLIMKKNRKRSSKSLQLCSKV